MHKKFIQVSDHFCETQKDIQKRAKQFAKQIPSYLKVPKRHLNLCEAETIATQNAKTPFDLSLQCNTHCKGIANYPI
jgi:hypothetical protein